MYSHLNSHFLELVVSIGQVDDVPNATDNLLGDGQDQSQVRHANHGATAKN